MTRYRNSSADFARNFGYLSGEELQALQYAVHDLSGKSARIVNIGAGIGTSSLAMREVCLDAELYSVDKEIRNTIVGLQNELDTFGEAGYSGEELPIQYHGDSKDIGLIWGIGDIDAIFIDGDHSRDGITGDINAWLPHVKQNGLIILHDYGSNDWPEVKHVADKLLCQQTPLSQVGTIKVYRRTSHPPFETVIPCAPVDTNKLPYVIDALTSFTDTISVNVITPDPMLVDTTRDYRVPVRVYADENVIKFDRSRFKYRPNWIFQQFIKLFQNVTLTDWYLVIDADLLFNRPIPFFHDDKPVFMLGLDQRHDPYFEFNKRMLGIGKTYPYSFLSECTLYSKYIVADLLRFSGCSSVDEFLSKSADIIDGGTYPADSEFYGSYVVHAQPDVYLYQKLRAVLGGKYGGEAWTKEEIEQRMREIGPQEADIYTIHSWEGEI